MTKNDPSLKHAKSLLTTVYRSLQNFQPSCVIYVFAAEIIDFLSIYFKTNVFI